MAMSGMDTAVRMPERINTFFNETNEQAAATMLAEGHVSFTVMMLDPKGQKTTVMVDWPADPVERDRSAEVLKAVAIAGDAVAVCVVTEGWALQDEHLEADGLTAKGCARYAEHPNRKEVVTCCLSYRKSERLFGAVLSRDIERDGDGKVTGLGAALKDLPCAIPDDGKGGRLNTLLSPRTPSGKQRELAARMLLHECLRKSLFY